MMCDFEYSNHQLFPLYPFRQCPACDQSSGMPLKIRFSCRRSMDSRLKSFKPNLPLKSEFFTHPKLPEEFFLIKRQLRGGNKTGIPDIVGVDKSGTVCIVEMKNTTVDESIIPQVLRMQFCTEHNRPGTSCNQEGDNDNHRNRTYFGYLAGYHAWMIETLLFRDAGEHPCRIKSKGI